MGEVPHSLYFEMLNLTVTLAKHFDMTPFELNKQDFDEVIEFVNYFIEKGVEPEEQKKAAPEPIYDGFWDF